jgi:AAA domain, putative AbiEii toxin, Type IV TA system
MFRAFLVEHFRGLNRCKVDDLRRITLITGKNNTGKTALLEAMFIHSGRYNPHLMMVVNAIRGIVKFSYSNTPESETPWQSLFTGYDDTQPVKLVGDVLTKPGHIEVVSMALSTVQSGLELSGLGSQIRAYNALDVEAGPTKVLKLELTVGRKPKPSKHFLIIGNKQQTVVPPPPTPDHQARFLSAHQRDTAETIASLFSTFQVRGQVEMIVDALRLMEPRLRELTLMFVGEPMLHGNIGLQERLLVPLALMGDGLNRLAGLVLAIGATPGGVVLVDDIDTGLHHGVMGDFWAAIVRAAELFDVQVVATTHSDECAKAAFDAVKRGKVEGELSLVRLERRDDHVASFTYLAPDLSVAFGADLEVR